MGHSRLSAGLASFSKQILKLLLSLGELLNLSLLHEGIQMFRVHSVLDLLADELSVAASLESLAHLSLPGLLSNLSIPLFLVVVGSDDGNTLTRV